MITVGLERTYDPGRGICWSLIEDAANRKRIPKENIGCVLRLSIIGDEEDQICVVPFSHADKTALIADASTYLHWHLEKHFWISKTVKFFDDAWLEKPNDKRLVSCFPMKGKKPAFAVALVANGISYETIWAFCGVLEDGDNKALSSFREFFDKFDQEVKGNREHRATARLATELAMERARNEELARELEEARAEIQRLQGDLLKRIPEPWGGVRELERLIMKHADDADVVFNKLLDYGWQQKQIALLLSGDRVSIDLRHSKGADKMLEGRITTFFKNYAKLATWKRTKKKIPCFLEP